jgi:hypothetical protein
MYATIVHSDVSIINKQIWKFEMSIKVQKFIWYIRKEARFTSYIIPKRTVTDELTLLFYNNGETINHLLVVYQFAHFVWSVIHKASIHIHHVTFVNKMCNIFR